jgi:hypothetical protein
MERAETLVREAIIGDARAQTHGMKAVRQRSFQCSTVTT